MLSLIEYCSLSLSPFASLRVHSEQCTCIIISSLSLSLSHGSIDFAVSQWKHTQCRLCENSRQTCPFFILALQEGNFVWLVLELTDVKCRGVTILYIEKKRSYTYRICVGCWERERVRMKREGEKFSNVKNTRYTRRTFIHSVNSEHKKYYTLSSIYISALFLSPSLPLCVERVAFIFYPLRPRVRGQSY